MPFYLQGPELSAYYLYRLYAKGYSEWDIACEQSKKKLTRAQVRDETAQIAKLHDNEISLLSFNQYYFIVVGCLSCIPYSVATIAYMFFPKERLLTFINMWALFTNAIAYQRHFTASIDMIKQQKCSDLITEQEFI